MNKIIYQPKGKVRRVRSNGYYAIYCPEHPHAFGRGFVYEHRLVMERHLGRLLDSSEIVHHIDGNRLNNDLSNLRLNPTIAHHKLEHRPEDSQLRKPGEENPTIFCECGCGASFKKYDSNGRPRRFIAGGHILSIDANKRKATIVKCRCGCGQEINLFDKYGRKKYFISGHNSKSVNSKTEIAKRAGLSYHTLLNYSKGKKLRKSTIQKIERSINHG